MSNKNSKTIYLVAGARPNFMKIAPIIRAIQAKSGELLYKLIHTDQHYDKAMSDVFFEELGIPEPDFHLGCGGGSHAEQTAKIMVKFEKVCLDQMPDCVLVVGDVNSTLACSIVAKKLGISVAHVEAGLRSGDLTMPEEINRLVTDSITDFFFVTEPSAVKHLLSEGKCRDRIFEVGHVMIDNLLYQFNKLPSLQGKLQSERYRKEHVNYGVVTLHRPSNVDDKLVLEGIFVALNKIAKDLPLCFPVHPRTQKNIASWDISVDANITLMPPQSYMEFLNLWSNAQVVLTDSGGLQEETTGLGVPCITLRENTERPITVEQGTNIVVGTNYIKIIQAYTQVINNPKTGTKPSLWDGHSAERIVDKLISLI